eukprot:TRINITY_DN8105_c0_g1_i1.p1 TRINITY_DN8105_c0_g1~~TRINITY_DN8105_c0_g1_i1.p1  ORF type:complete len:278 (+),score=65.81 TRINITY_DN8105_c0_g1_i1:104-835(+)
MEATESMQHTMDLKLHPRHLDNPKRGLQLLVHDTLMKYSSKLGGVPVKADRITLGQRSGMIYEDQAAVHVKAVVDYQVFKPQPKQILTGIVKKVTQSHVGVLVNGQFSASIAHSELPEGFSYNDELQSFVFQDTPENAIEVDTRIRFMVKVLETSTHGVISIIGSMRTPEAGIVAAPSSNTPPAVGHSKKRPASATPISASQDPDDEIVIKPKAKKSKKDKKAKKDKKSKDKKAKKKKKSKHA